MHRPYAFEFNISHPMPSRYAQHILHTLSDLKGQFNDQVAFERILKTDNTLVHEVFENSRPELVEELSLPRIAVHILMVLRMPWVG